MCRRCKQFPPFTVRRDLFNTSNIQCLREFGIIKAKENSRKATPFCQDRAETEWDFDIHGIFHLFCRVRNNILDTTKLHNVFRFCVHRFHNILHFHCLQKKYRHSPSCSILLAQLMGL